MATLLLQLVGPMQSWGTISRFDERDTGKEPSKSGVIGLLAAALGIDRENWNDLAPLCRLRMGVRHDRPGTLKRDYQTAREVISADRTKVHDTAVSVRHYLADAAFLVGLAGDDRPLLARCHDALANPAWPLALGRKSYVPSEPMWMAGALLDSELREALAGWPSITEPRTGQESKLLLSLESADGAGLMKMDQLLSSFGERRFGPRFVLSEVIDVPVQARS